jgi:serine/threonine-protein kinase
MTEPDAVDEVKEAGLKPNVLRQFHEEIPAGIVIGWDPEEGKQAKGTEVIITVSDGPQPRAVPDLANKTWEEAEKALTELGLVPKRVDDYSSSVKAGQVISTQPAAGEQAAKGSEVAVKVSQGPKKVKVPNVSGLSVDEAEEKLNSVGLRVKGVSGSTRRSVKSTSPAAGTEVNEGTGITLITE